MDATLSDTSTTTAAVVAATIIARAAPTTPSVTNPPGGAVFGGSFTAAVSTSGDGTKLVASSTTTICTVGADGLTVSFVAPGTCTLTALVSQGADYLAATGTAQSFSVARATPSTPSVSNLPVAAVAGGSFTAAVSTSGDGTKSVASSTTTICTVGADGLTVSFVAPGTCTLTALVSQGADYFAATGTAQSFSIASPPPPTVTVPGSPGGLTASAGVSSVTLSWVVPSSDGGSAVTGYQVYEGTRAGGESTAPVACVYASAAVTSCTVTGLADGTTYFFIVEAANAVGLSGPSSEVAAAPQAPPAPPVSRACSALFPRPDVVGVAGTASGNGYWIASATGAVAACGDAQSFALPAISP